MQCVLSLPTSLRLLGTQPASHAYRAALYLCAAGSKITPPPKKNPEGESEGASEESEEEAAKKSEEAVAAAKQSELEAAIEKLPTQKMVTLFQFLLQQPIQLPEPWLSQLQTLVEARLDDEEMDMFGLLVCMEVGADVCAHFNMHRNVRGDVTAAAVHI